MKIKNIIWIFLAVLSFASCSKDNEGDNIPQEPVDAVISLSAIATNQKTKADADPSLIGKEDWINSLNAYIFNKGTGQLVGYKRVDGAKDSSISEIDGILIKIVPGADGTSTEVFTLVLLANIGDHTFNTLEELKKATSLGGNLADLKVGVSYLPMGSEPLTFEGVKKSEKVNGVYTTNNWVTKDGGKVVESKAAASEILLTRMVSRVEVDEVSVNLSGTDYEGSTFELQTIALVNVRSGVDAFGKGIGPYVKGYQSAGYNYLPEKDKGWWIPTTESGKTYTTTLVPSLSQSYTFDTGIANGEYTFGNLVEANPKFCRYVFPNAKTSAGAEYETGVVVGGKFKYQGGKEVLKHFIVKLNAPNASDRSPEVLANTVYKLRITIEGEGSEDENHPQETAGVNATITVKDWEVIEQEDTLPPIKPV